MKAGVPIITVSGAILRYIGTTWAHCCHPVGHFRILSLAAGYWWGLVGSEDEFL